LHKISILIANYNNSHFFKDCYESLLNQTYKDFEVIILDDFSNYEDYKNIKNLISNDNRFRIFRNQSNKGVGFTKRKLVELASNEICGFLDPDDYPKNSFSPNSRACGRRFQICSCSTGPSAKFSNQDVSLTGAQTIKIWGNFDMGCAFIPSIRNDNDKTKRVCPTKFKSHATRVIA